MEDHSRLELVLHTWAAGAESMVLDSDMVTDHRMELEIVQVLRRDRVDHTEVGHIEVAVVDSLIGCRMADTGYPMDRS